MKIQIIVLNLLVFVALVGIMAVDGGDVKYTFDKKAVAAKNAADSAALAKEMANPYIKITTTASAYNEIGDWIVGPGKTLLVVDVIIEDHGYNDLLISPSDFSVKINGTVYYQGTVWHNLKSIGRQYLTGDILIDDGDVWLNSGDIRKGSLLFVDTPFDIEKYELAWGLSESYNTTIDGVYAGKENATTINAYDETINGTINAYDEAIRLDPNNAKTWYDKSNFLAYNGRTSEAKAAYAKAKDLGFTG